MNILKLRTFLFGPPRDLFNKDTRTHIALVALLAWVGLGADGLSSSAYGPAEAYLALGSHTQLALFMALVTAATVFIISLAYTQVIELFPEGGGGYRVASRLIGPRAGLLSGSALIVDYVLTLSISVAAGADAIFSMLPLYTEPFKLGAECLMVFVLMYLNLRGMKESIKILLPIFLSFFVSHVLVILYGITMHSQGLPQLMPNAVHEASAMAGSMGWFAMLALFLKAFSLGGGTYTGLEAVSNGVGTMAEPRATTAKLTMYYVATSLAFTAAGIICLYLLWHVAPRPGETLNATVYNLILGGWQLGSFPLGKLCVFFLLITEAGLLFVAANTGFLSGPSVLANMGTDKWMPYFFSSLSSRLVTKNGVILIGLAAFLTMLLTRGRVDELVVLYSINVFLTFSLTMLGLCIHWWKSRSKGPWLVRMCIAGVGLIVTSTILVITTVEKFHSGGWLTLLLTGCVIALGLRIKRGYDAIEQKVHQVDELFAAKTEKKTAQPPPIDPTLPTAVLIMHETAGSGMHTLLWILRLFPNVYKNFVFVSVGAVDSDAFIHEDSWQTLRRDVKESVKYCVNYCHNHALPATSYLAFGTDKLDKMTELTEKVAKEFPKAVFFSSKLMFDDESLFTQILHNQNAYILQRRLHNRGFNMIILPMKV